MKAAVLHGQGDLRLEERPRPVPKADELLVRVRAVGLCGSDLHFYHEGRIGDKIVERPFVLGHEAAGEVVEVGPAVTRFQVGDRVCLEPGLPCRKCAFCKRGEYHLCPTGVFQSAIHVDGFFQEYAAIPEDHAFRLPSRLSFAEGCLMEPFAVGLHAASRGNVQPGATVAILGSGPIGLVALLASIQHGATTTIVSDVVDRRLALAKELGATHVCNAARVDAVDEVMRLTSGLGADVVLETAGAVPTQQQSVYAARKGGTVVWVGMAGQPVVPIDTMHVIRAELNLKGSWRYANQFPKALALAAEGRVNLSPLASHNFPLTQIKEAFEFGLARKDLAIKVVVTI